MVLPRVVLRSAVLAVFVALLVGSGLVASPASAAPPVPPSADPFYTPDGPIAGRAPGAILKTRVVQLGLSGRQLPATATQLLYRTNDQFGKPSATVTTIISPPGARPGTPRRVISYHAFYDALGSECDPSYSLRGGATSNSPLDAVVISGMLAAGYTVVVPDYEGRNLRWTMGLESGHAALDSVRAALRYLRAPVRTPIGLYGYSGGSVPTGWGAEIAPRYAPELNIVGAAAGGVVVNPIHNLAYVDGSQKWAGVIPALMTVYNETYRLGISKYLSPKGVRVLSQVRGECIINFASKYPGLTDESLLRPQVGSLLNVPGMRAAAEQNIMGSRGTPRAPMFLGVGKSDATGDGIMITGDVRALASTYCRRGLPTTFQEYRGLKHSDALFPWSVDAQRFLNQRFAGAPAGGCGR
ncbi:lipase family protein [Gordonia sp. ABSL49_1]|uniref:lipase family protein n=1 Tax=Gordonia sp. ABSL49_1 TaxID=2920941 RepID=UPI0035AF3020